MKKNVNRKPNADTINAFSDIRNFIQNNQTSEEKRLKLQLRETQKMPFKRYMRIKRHVIKKQKNNESQANSNSIIAQTHMQKKLMTNIIEERVREKKLMKDTRKLNMSYNKTKAKFREGILKISNNFIKEMQQSKGGNSKTNNSNNNNKRFDFNKNLHKNKIFNKN